MAERIDRTATTRMPGDGHRLTAAPPIDDLTFDDALAELQRTIAELETGGQPLERTLALHERGAALLERCETLLRERRVADAPARGEARWPRDDRRHAEGGVDEG